MKQILMYANVAKRAMVSYDPATGEARKTKSMVSGLSPDQEVVSMIKSFLAKHPNENFSFITNRNISIPVFQAMKVVNFVLMQKYTEDDLEQVEEYMSNIVLAGIDMATLDPKDRVQVKALCIAAMNNTWLEEDVLDFMLDLMLDNDHKFQNIDSLIEDLKENVVLSDVAKNVRNLALTLINDTCAIPVVTMEESEDEVI